MQETGFDASLWGKNIGGPKPERREESWEAGESRAGTLPQMACEQLRHRMGGTEKKKTLVLLAENTRPPILFSYQWAVIADSHGLHRGSTVLFWLLSVKVTKKQQLCGRTGGFITPVIKGKEQGPEPSSREKAILQHSYSHH